MSGNISVKYGECCCQDTGENISKSKTFVAAFGGEWKSA
jgi:hypothetical protein